MKIKNSFLITLAILLVFSSSCAVRVGGHVRVPRVHKERHHKKNRSDHNPVRPIDDPFRNASIVAPYFQLSSQVPGKCFSAIDFN